MATNIRRIDGSWRAAQGAVADLESMSSATATAILARSKRSVALCFVVLSGIAWALALHLAHPSYVASASVLIHEHQAQPSSSPQRSEVVTTDIVAIRTQLDVLQSRD